MWYLPHTGSSRKKLKTLSGQRSDSSFQRLNDLLMSDTVLASCNPHRRTSPLKQACMPEINHNWALKKTEMVYRKIKKKFAILKRVKINSNSMGCSLRKWLTMSPWYTITAMLCTQLQTLKGYMTWLCLNTPLTTEKLDKLGDERQDLRVEEAVEEV